MSDSLWPHELQYTRLESFTISQSWLRLMSIESVMPSNHLILCLLLPSIFFSIRAFSNELAKWHATSLQSCLILQPHWLSVSRLLCPWDSPDKNMGVVSLALLQLMFPTQGLNPCFLCFLHWQVGSLPLATPVVVVQSLSCVPLFVIPRTAAHQASLFFTISPSLLKLMSIESAIPSNHLILCLPLLFLPSIFPSIRVFSKGSALHITWPNYWSFSISPSMNIPGWFPLGLTCLVSLQSKRLLRVFSNTAVQKHQFFGTQPSSWSNSHIHTWLREKP